MSTIVETCQRQLGQESMKVSNTVEDSRTKWTYFQIIQLSNTVEDSRTKCTNFLITQMSNTVEDSRTKCSKLLDYQGVEHSRGLCRKASKYAFRPPIFQKNQIFPKQNKFLAKNNISSILTIHLAETFTCSNKIQE